MRVFFDGIEVHWPRFIDIVTEPGGEEAGAIAISIWGGVLTIRPANPADSHVTIRRANPDGGPSSQASLNDTAIEVIRFAVPVSPYRSDSRVLDFGGPPRNPAGSLMDPTPLPKTLIEALGGQQPPLRNPNPTPGHRDIDLGEHEHGEVQSEQVGSGPGSVEEPT